MPIVGNQSSGGKRPTTPTIGTATAGDTTASVAFTPSTYIGKGTITYTAVSNPGNISATSSGSPINVTGLTNGTAYTFTVSGSTNYSVNSAVSAASNSVTPAASGPASQLFSQLTAFNTTNASQTSPGGFDSSSNVYSIGGLVLESGFASSQNTYVSKLNPAGNSVLFTNKVINDSTQGMLIGGSFVDSSGNIYITQYNTSGMVAYINKISSSGSSTWSKKLTLSTAYSGGLDPTSIDVDASGNVYAVIPEFYGNYAVVKLNSSGTTQWVRGYSGAPQGEGEGAVAPFPPLQFVKADSSGNVYVAGWTRDLYGGKLNMYLAKLNSAGTIQWQYSWGNGSSFELTDTIGLDMDSSGNIYLLTRVSANSNPLITKINSSGTLQWQRAMNHAYNNYAFSVSPNGTVYAIGTAGGNSMTLFSYNTSGSLGYSYLYTSSGSRTFTAPKIESTDSSLFITTTRFQTSQAVQNLHIKMPSATPPSSFTIAGTTYTRSTSGTSSNGTFTSVTTESAPWSDYSAFLTIANPSTSITSTPISVAVGTY